MTAKIFIDGEHGTTGLQIRERLNARDDIEVLSIAFEDRRDEARRLEMFKLADVVILCLPDDAARAAVAMVEEAQFDCRIIDTSTAHRSSDDWVFGFAELCEGQAGKIAQAERVSNPGCYSTGAIALLRPLIEAGIIPRDHAISINAVSGYTGGGKQLIAQMEDTNHDGHIEESFYAYGLGLAHKHVPEIMARSGLDHRPIFVPSVSRFAQGMLVSIPLHVKQLCTDSDPLNIHAALANHYGKSSFVHVASPEENASTTRLAPESHAGRDDMKLWVFAHGDNSQVNLVAQLDNLGKGASGAAVQNLDLMLKG